MLRIAPEAWIDNLLKKIKDREENPPEEPDEPEPELNDPEDPESGFKERPPKPDWLPPLERQVFTKLQSGDAPSDSEIGQMIKEMVESSEA